MSGRIEATEEAAEVSCRTPAVISHQIPEAPPTGVHRGSRSQGGDLKAPHGLLSWSREKANSGPEQKRGECLRLGGASPGHCG